jgi:excisionase family DNA binding protein
LHTSVQGAWRNYEIKNLKFLHQFYSQYSQITATFRHVPERGREPMHPTTNDPPPRLPARTYTLKQAAEVLGIGYRTVERMCRTGAIRSVLVSPRRRLVPIAEIDRILAGAPCHEQECA